LMKVTTGRNITAALITVIFLTVEGLAQQTSNVASTSGAATAPLSKAAVTPATGSPELTERERMLLDRIEKLERRLAEIESRESRAATTTGEAIASTTARTGESSKDVRSVSAVNPSEVNATSNPTETTTQLSTIAINTPAGQEKPTN